MSSEFTYEAPNAQAFIHNLREYLKSKKRTKIFELLTGTSCEFCASNSYSGKRWNAYSTTIRFNVPIDKLNNFTDEIQEEILKISEEIMPKPIGFDLDDIEISPILTLPDEVDFINNTDALDSPENNQKNSFTVQFPFGMPFGMKKPHVAVIPCQGSQEIYFEEKEDVGVIKENVYPNFTYIELERKMRETPIGKLNLKTVLENMSQTENEKLFFQLYASSYDMWNQEIPVLIPQAWIQWHSSTKEDLRSSNSSYVDDLYRVDFVAFWKNKRFAILIDDIGHYAKKYYKYWNADEERYSMRLKEDRKLRKEGWEVFRTSNWEIRQEKFRLQLLIDLKDYLSF
ncbi:hypothetical protein [Nodularia chucula]|uniref:hypothetical protein n=1 Tax=Nodularia chucula TaxID=3093667 RepID=UPI0039C6051F